jgi:hypothetical protein
MPIYRIYTTDPDGYLFGIPKIAECVDDKEAVEKAVLWANDLDVEIWDRRRFVAWLPPPEAQSAGALQSVQCSLALNSGTRNARASLTRKLA